MSAPNSVTTPDLLHLESVIERGLKTFFEVGNALIEIRDNRLYKERYSTWAEYLSNRWGISPQRASQLIGASLVADTIGDSYTLKESQLNALKKVDDSAKHLVLQVATQASEMAHKTLTASAITKTIEALQEFSVTGAVSIGDEQIKVIDLITHQVSAEIIEAHKRNVQRVQDSNPPVIKGEMVVTDGALNIPLADGVYQVIIYRKN